MIKLSLVVVLYNEFDLVSNCLTSIYENEIPGMEIILSDNSDKSGVEKILKKFPKLIYIKNKKNLGYSMGATVGYKHAKGTYLLILTPDTTLFPNTIKQTLTFMEENEEIVVVGCRIYSYPKVLQQSVFHDFPNLLTHLYEYNLPFYKLCKIISPTYHPTLFTENEHKKELIVKHMIGAYMLMRKEVIDTVGFFDKRYFMYREETDLCKRLYNKGWKVVFLPVGGLTHHQNPHKTIEFTQASPQYEKSTYIFFQIHYGKLYAGLVWFLALFSVLISLLYLFPVVILKKTFRLPSQSNVLLHAWVKILYWHIFEGPKVIFGFR